MRSLESELPLASGGLICPTHARGDCPSLKAERCSSSQELSFCCRGVPLWNQEGNTDPHRILMAFWFGNSRWMLGISSSSGTGPHCDALVLLWAHCWVFPCRRTHNIYRRLLKLWGHKTASAVLMLQSITVTLQRSSANAVIWNSPGEIPSLLGVI